MVSLPSPRRSICAAAALAMLAGLSIASAAVNVTVRFDPGVLSFSPLDPALYGLFVSITGTGFTDDANLDNYLLLRSATDRFSSDYYPARGTGSGTTGSTVYSSATELSSIINSESAWTLTVTDGVTHTTRQYSVTVSTPGIDENYLRPIILDTNPGETISDSPTFTFSQDAAVLPQSFNTSGFAFMIGNRPNNYVQSPALEVSDVSWTPDNVPLLGDTYVVVVAKVNDAPPQTLVHATNPAPLSGAPALGSFSQSVHIQVSAQSGDLVVPSDPAVDVIFNFSPAVISFSPLDPPVYILGLGLQATGFTDDDNIDNFIEVHSGDDSFSSDFYPARGTGSGTAGSIGLSSTEELSDAINNAGTWNLTLTDGVTGSVRHFTMEVTTPGIDPGYIRPLTLDVNPGATISANPTFNVSQPPTSLPNSENDYSFAFMIGDSPNNYVLSPAFLPSDNSWTPDGPLTPDHYVVVLSKSNLNPPQTLVQATTPVPTTGAPLLSFSQTIKIQCDSQSSGLIVVGCTSDFDGDGDYGTDADIEAFFACLGGSCCALCQTSDFNGDGDFGTDADIEAFFSVLGGGHC